MTWVKLDDAMPEDEKILEVGALGFALAVAAICYCNRQQTDGHLPRRAARTLTDTDEYGVSIGDVIAGLVEQDIWHIAGHGCPDCPQPRNQGGYYLHSYLKYQPSAAQIQEQAEQKKLAGQKGGQAAARARRERGQADDGAAPLTTSRTPGGDSRSNGSGPPPGQAGAPAPAEPPAAAPATAGAQAKSKPDPVSRSRIPGSKTERSSSSQGEVQTARANHHRDDDDDRPHGQDRPLDGTWRTTVRPQAAGQSTTDWTRACLDDVANRGGDPIAYAQVLADHYAGHIGTPAGAGAIHILRGHVLDHPPYVVLDGLTRTLARNPDKPLGYLATTLANMPKEPRR